MIPGFYAKFEEDFMRRDFKMHVMEATPGGRRYLCGDGQWWSAPENAEVINSGITIPHDALEVIVTAGMRTLGDALPSVGEIKTLREWLEVERRRVDHRLGL